MTEAVVRTWLKVNDPTALTARETLQRALEYGRRVKDVHRSTVWAFRWQGEADAKAVLDHLAEDTNLIQNPNKHRREVVHGETALSPRGNAWVLVHTVGVGKEIEEAMARHRLVSGEIPAVRRGTLWELDLAEEENRWAMAEEIAITRGRKRGLLGNPHVEEIHVFASAPRAAELAGLLMEGRA